MKQIERSEQPHAEILLSSGNGMIFTLIHTRDTLELKSIYVPIFASPKMLPAMKNRMPAIF